MNQKTSKIIKIAVSLALASVLLWFSFKGVKWGEFFTELKACNWFYVLCSMLCGAAAFAFRGLRWRDILRPIDPSTRALPAINAINISNLANMVIPYSGEFIRCGVITRHSARDPKTGKALCTYDRVLGTAALERSWDLLSIVLLLILLLSFAWDRFGTFMTDRIFTPAIEGLTTGKILVAALVLAVLILFIVLVVVLRKRYAFFGRVFGVVERIWQGFVSCFKMDRKALFFLYTMLIWAMYWLQMVFTILAMPSISSLGLWDALFLMLAGSVVSVLPIPGGFGAYHYIVPMALLTVYGFPQATVGIVFATLAHESQALTMIITGSVSYLIESLSSRKKAIATGQGRSPR